MPCPCWVPAFHSRVSASSETKRAGGVLGRLTRALKRQRGNGSNCLQGRKSCLGNTATGGSVFCMEARRFGIATAISVVVLALADVRVQMNISACLIGLNLHKHCTIPSITCATSVLHSSTVFIDTRGSDRAYVLSALPNRLEDAGRREGFACLAGLRNILAYLMQGDLRKV